MTIRKGEPSEPLPIRAAMWASPSIKLIHVVLESQVPAMSDGRGLAQPAHALQQVMGRSWYMMFTQSWYDLARRFSPEARRDIYGQRYTEKYVRMRRLASDLQHNDNLKTLQVTGNRQNSNSHLCDLLWGHHPGARIVRLGCASAGRPRQDQSSFL